MNIFGVPEARYFCRRFKAGGGASAMSLKEYVANTLKGSPAIKEGSGAFDDYRDCALREAERCLLLAVSNYRRALDLMVPAASGWAHVTLYYSSYYAAHAIVCIFGGWIGDYETVEVKASQPGAQELWVNRKPQSTLRGSHRRFWDLFYQGTATLGPWIRPRLRFAILPVSGNVVWQIEKRNEVNYDSLVACELARDFQATFRAGTFPASLPGSLSTQFSIAGGLLAVLARFVRQFGLRTDALDGLRPLGDRRRKMQRLVMRDHAPRLYHRVGWRSVIV